MTVRYAIMDKHRQVIDGETYDAKDQLFRNMSYCSSRWLDSASVWVLDFEAGTMRDVTADMVSEWWSATGETDTWEYKENGDDLPIFAEMLRRGSLANTMKGAA